MQSKLLHSEGGQNTFALVFAKGDNLPDVLLNFAKENNITAAEFRAIGAFSRVVLGYFDRDKKDYKRIPIEEQVEVVSLIGNIASLKASPKCTRTWW